MAVQFEQSELVEGLFEKMVALVKNSLYKVVEAAKLTYKALQDKDNLGFSIHWNCIVMYKTSRAKPRSKIVQT